MFDNQIIRFIIQILTLEYGKYYDEEKKICQRLICGATER